MQLWENHRKTARNIGKIIMAFKNCPGSASTSTEIAERNVTAVGQSHSRPSINKDAKKKPCTSGYSTTLIKKDEHFGVGQT